MKHLKIILCVLSLVQRTLGAERRKESWLMSMASPENEQISNVFIPFWIPCSLVMTVWLEIYGSLYEFQQTISNEWIRKFSFVSFAALFASVLTNIEAAPGSCQRVASTAIKVGSFDGIKDSCAPFSFSSFSTLLNYKRKFVNPCFTIR